MADQHDPDASPRTGPEEQEYLLRRAADHGRCADATQDADARAIHLRLRQLYLTRADHAVMVHED
jgi:hypothetical protein